jgi:hypothetical protein
VTGSLPAPLLVALRFALAYVLLAAFWASASLGVLPLPLGVGVIDLSALDAPSAFDALADASGLDALRAWPGLLVRLCERMIGSADEGARYRSYALASLLGGVVVPLALARLLGARSLADLGLGRPGATAWPVLGLLVVASLPLSVVMAHAPVFREALAARLAGSPWYGLAVVVGGLAEHVFFHGVLLAWLHPSGRFPDAAALRSPLVLPGRRLPHGGRAGLAASLRSLALPWDCLAPCVLSAPLFFAVHAGTTDAELWLSPAAGALLAWLAYRTGGWALPALAHLAVSLVAALVVLVSG